jgi:phage I-like protein
MLTPGAEADEGTGPGAQDVPQGADAKAAEPGAAALDALPQEWQYEIRRLRDEAAKNRVAAKRVEEESRKREQARLAEEGRWKELAAQREAELGQLVPYRERAETLEGLIRASNEKRVKEIREDMRAMVPTEYPPEKLAEWLDANLRLLTTKPAPSIDAGAGGSGKAAVTLTPEQKEIARRMGVTEEQYIKHMNP